MPSAAPFVDSHLHGGLLAASLTSVDLRCCRSTAEAADLVRRAAADAEAGRWILGRGYDINRFAAGDEPSRAALDRAAPDHPVHLASHDVHAAWVNSAALRSAHVGRGTPDPHGGRIVRDPRGEPTGVLLENAVDLVKRVLPRRTLEQWKDDLLAVQEHLLAREIGAVHDFDFDAGEAWRALADEGALRLRVATTVAARDLRRAIRDGVRSDATGGAVRHGGVKFFLDGALGSRTAAMLEPYADRPGWTGMALYPFDRLVEELTLCRDHGLRPLIHAIGDAAVRLALDAILAVGAFPRAIRPRIEHAQTVADEDLGRFAASGAVASMQPIHMTTDIDVATRALGERARLAFRCRSLLDRGVPLIFGSDAPVEIADPRLGVALAVERRRPGRDEPPFFPEERITPAQALAASTTAAAAELGF